MQLLAIVALYDGSLKDASDMFMMGNSTVDDLEKFKGGSV